MDEYRRRTVRDSGVVFHRRMIRPEQNGVILCDVPYTCKFRCQPRIIVTLQYVDVEAYRRFQPYS